MVGNIFLLKRNVFDREELYDVDGLREKRISLVVDETFISHVEAVRTVNFATNNGGDCNNTEKN